MTTQRFSEAFIADVKARTDLPALIGRSVALKRSNGDFWGLCPLHDEKTPSFKVDRKHGFFHCFGCGAHGDAIQFMSQVHGLDFTAAVEQLAVAAGVIEGETKLMPHCIGFPRPPATSNGVADRDDAESRTKAAYAIWQASLPAQGTAVQVYLESRGITVPVPPSIRYHPNLKHGFTGLFFEAMVAGVQAPNRTITAVHRTFLLPGGKGKANVKKPKLALGPCAGGAVRLAAAGPELVLAEGIETALSVLQATNKPMWATVGTSGLKTVALPQEVETVIIAADGDECGIAAAEEAAKRFWREGRTVKIAEPPPGYDFNDLLMLPENVTPFRPKDVANG